MIQLPSKASEALTLSFDSMDLAKPLNHIVDLCTWVKGAGEGGSTLTGNVGLKPLYLNSAHLVELLGMIIPPHFTAHSNLFILFGKL